MFLQRLPRSGRSELLVSAVLGCLLVGCAPADSGGRSADTPEDAPAVEQPAPAESSATTADLEAEVVAVLERQQAAWNRGDIDAFMDDYVRGERLRFTSGGTVRRGWQTTLERYRSNYPDRAAMGRLEFSQLEVTVLSDRFAEVHGRWQLQRETDAPGGWFTLLLEREPSSGSWRIVHDHTSSDEPPG